MRKKSNQQGLFITFEGIDGCGKTTQAILTYQYLSARGLKINLLREPGSTKIAEHIRKILLTPDLNFGSTCELLLYEAARAELVQREIAPLLRRGEVVLCDRFYDSTTAYQGFGRKLDLRMVRQLHRVAVDSIVPDITFVFDCDIDTSIARRKGKPDRLESQSRAFFNRVRRGYLDIARKERHRVKVIDALQNADDTFAEVVKLLKRKLRSYESLHTG
ncbi:MAG: dTMP kinase [candidate division Zixibacteria bacterium]|nr:dTMP kinase [candidate division Zixibacteria bacterium]